MIRRRKLTLLIGSGAVSLSGCLSGDNSTATRGTDSRNGIDTDEMDIDRATERISEEASFEFAPQPSESIQTNKIKLALNDAKTALERAENNDRSATNEEIEVYREYA